MPHEAMWLYQVLVAWEEVTLAISKGGKDFTCFLRLQIHWCDDEHVHAVFT
jgi:hypothetical protein